jgi:hypothetical protein
MGLMEDIYDAVGDAFEEAGDLDIIHAELSRTMLRTYCTDCGKLMVIKQTSEKLLGIGPCDEIYIWDICEHCGKVVLRGV